MTLIFQKMILYPYLYHGYYHDHQRTSNFENLFHASNFHCILYGHALATSSVSLSFAKFSLSKINIDNLLYARNWEKNETKRTISFMIQRNHGTIFFTLGLRGIGFLQLLALEYRSYAFVCY